MNGPSSYYACVMAGGSGERFWHVALPSLIGAAGFAASAWFTSPLPGMLALSIAAGLVKAILVMIATPLIARRIGLDNPHTAMVYGGTMGTNSGVSAGLADVIHKCLAEKPAERYPDAGALAADELEAANASVLAIRDACWAVSRDRIGTARAVEVVK